MLCTFFLRWSMVPLVEPNHSGYILKIIKISKQLKNMKHAHRIIQTVPLRCQFILLNQSNYLAKSRNHGFGNGNKKFNQCRKASVMIYAIRAVNSKYYH